MEDDSSSGPIPSRWILKSDVQKDGSKSSCYYCPGTGLHFYSYSDLMRYLNCTMEEKVGIYSLDSKRKLKAKASSALKLKTKTGMSAQRRYSSGSSSKSSAVKQGKETVDVNETSNPQEGTEEKSAPTGTELKEDKLPTSESTNQDGDDQASNLPHGATPEMF